MTPEAGAGPEAWRQCPHCKELCGGVYDKKIKLSDIVVSASKCSRCWALHEVLGHVTDTSDGSTTLVGSIWHDNTLEIGIIGPGHTFDTAPGFKIYLVASQFSYLFIFWFVVQLKQMPNHYTDDSQGKHARLNPTLGIPIAVSPTHENHRRIKESREERYALAKSWLLECVSSHDTCEADDKGYELPRRLLDTADDQEIRLIRTEDNLLPGAAYVALSYCWGPNGGNLCTFKANLGEHMKGIPITSLPQTIRDVIFACKQLGQRYLWVDALCIVQDDPDDKRTQIPQMADIYSGALLAVSAAASSGVLEGCPLAPTELQPVQPQVFELAYASAEERLPGEESERRVTVVIEKMEHERCRKLPGHWAHETFDQDARDLVNPIEERAWCFQERFLARRTLFIGKGELSWICASEVQCECRKSGPQIKTQEGDRVFTHRFNLSQVSVKKLFLESELDKTYSFLWSDIVTEYSARMLTQFGDRVAALEGVSVAFRRRWPHIYRAGDYAFGCWRPFLGDLLVWTASGEPVSAQIGRGLFPSWSWASCGRPVTFTSWIWYGVHPKSWAQVVGLEVQLAGAGGEFGHGKGILTIRAPLIPAGGEVVKDEDGTEEILLTPLDPQLSFLRGWPVFDDPSKDPGMGKTATHLVMLASYPYKGRVQKSRPLSCALLCVAPVPGRVGEFCRVGMITTPRIKEDFWGFRFERLLRPHVTEFKLV